MRSPEVFRLRGKPFLPFAALIVFLLGAVQLHAADAGDLDPQALRARQVLLFEKLQDKPDNLDLMFEYAVASILLRDYEPAIATLERMLIYQPDLPRVKLELGSAYFRLGSYEVARFYFSQVLEGDPPDEVRGRVEAFMAEIDASTKRSAFSFALSAGFVYSRVRTH